MRALLALMIMAMIGAAACSSDDPDAAADPSGSTTTSAATPTTPLPTTALPTTTSTTAAPATTSTLPPPAGDGRARAVITPTGIVAAVVEISTDGSFVVTSPCGSNVRVHAGSPLTGAHVVLDPGHGGDEPGAVGPDGLRESDLNLAVARVAQAELEARGATVVLTRTSDYRITLASRAAIVTALDADAFVSIHHNAGPDHYQDTPGTEMYYQSQGGDEAKRLGGLLYEETVAALSPYDIEWASYRDAQVKVRLGAEGSDYYGILRRTTGVPGVLAELAYVTNPPEEALLRTPEFQAVEGAAVARAVMRYLTTDDQGSGFVGPSDRTAPAGPGGGAQGCVDPPLE